MLGNRKPDSVKGQEWYQADDVAQEYDEKRFSKGGQLIDQRGKQAVLNAIGPVEDKQILEIACGTGRFTAMLAERGADIIGLDISGPMLQQGRQRAQSAGVADSLEYMRGDAGRLPFPDDHFDVVFAMRFFHLADTPAEFLAEMCRVSNDQIFFDTFNRHSTRSLYNWALPMGSRLYSSTEVHSLLDTVDLELHSAEHDWIFPYGLYREIPNRVASGLRWIDGGIRRLPLGDRIASVSYWNGRL
jgi:SAM-dependent methyltransferase